jgi:hypothetical protein
MDHETQVLEFLGRTRKDSELSEKMVALFSKHGRAQQTELIAMAHELGYTFTDEQFRAAMTDKIATQFSSREPLPKPEPPESACGSRCISYTRNWHPE